MQKIFQFVTSLFLNPIQNNSLAYRPDIDGLRAIAVLSVIFFHAFPTIITGGFIGVDIFFVISGYLITSIIVKELNNDSFSIINFYERRVRRILPALYLLLLLCLPFVYILLSPGDIKEFSGSIISVATFTSNILFYKIISYFNADAELKPLLHTWSLAVEEQFYLLFPILLIFIWKLKRFWILAILTAIAGMSLGFAEWGANHNARAAFFLPHTRMWELLSGAFVAFYFEKELFHKHKFIREILTFVGLSLIFTSVLIFNEKVPYPSFFTLIPILGTVLILLFGQSNTISANFLRSKLLVSIGLISYSLYLYHQPIFAFYRYTVTDGTNIFAMLLLISLTFILAFLSWTYIEQPFRNKHVFKRKTVFNLAALFTILFLAIGLLGYKTSGFKKLKMNEKQLQLFDKANYNPPHNPCLSADLKDKRCANYLDNVTWVVFGDSHAGGLAQALGDALAIKSVNLLSFSSGGCKPSYGVVNRCADWTNNSVNYIVNNKKIKYVVITYRINRWLFGEHRGKYPELPNDVTEDDRQATWNSYVKLAKYFVSSGKKVIIVLQAPELPKRIVYLIGDNKKSLQDINGVTKKWWDARSLFVKSRLYQLPKEVTIIDPSKQFCDANYCKAVINGVPLYHDYDHMSYLGNEQVANDILNIIDK